MLLLKVIKKIIYEYILILLVITIALTLFKVFGFSFEFFRYTNDFALNGAISLALGVFDCFKQSLVISAGIELLFCLLRLVFSTFKLLIKSKKVKV